MCPKVRNYGDFRQHVIPTIIMCMLRGTPCYTGISYTFYGENICSVVLNFIGLEMFISDLTSYIHMALVLIIWWDCPLSDLVTLGTLEPSGGQHHIYKLLIQLFSLVVLQS